MIAVVCTTVELESWLGGCFLSMAIVCIPACIQERDHPERACNFTAEKEGNRLSVSLAKKLRIQVQEETTFKEIRCGVIEETLNTFLWPLHQRRHIYPHHTSTSMQHTHTY